MSMTVNFEPHSWYRGHAIKHNENVHTNDITQYRWESVYYDGVRGRWIEHCAMTIKELKRKIKG